GGCERRRAWGAPGAPHVKESAMIDPAFMLEKKIALVVGAANGIGRATALAFAASGAAVACADVEDAKATAAEIEKSGARACRVPSPGRPAYCATKGALIQLAKVLAADHAAQGIRANTISPGAIETRRMLRRWKDMDEARKMMGPEHLLNRLGRPEEIARAAV